jgi:5-methylcytosine-specific restriction enzyme A
MPARAQRMPTRVKQRKRESATKRGYNTVWQREAKRYLARNPLCAVCRRAGKLTPAVCVDHIRPHRGNQVLFWDLANNVQGLCTACHAAKTARGE